MPSSEVQRTLVKSPPELWAELSDPASLAKHLGDFGEIRTTRVQPETAVEWEAEDVRGVVKLKPSGWGTKVTLTAIRESPAEEIVPVDENVPDLEAMPEPQAEPQPEPELDSQPESTLDDQPEPALDSQPTAEPGLEPALRPGLFARIMRRWRKERRGTDALSEAEVKPEAQTEPEPELQAPEPQAPEPQAPELQAPELQAPELQAPEPQAPAPEAELELQAEPAVELESAADPEQAPTPDRPDLAAELAQVEAEMQAQDAALLSAVLDRLGAAHHRPFSRG